MKWFKHLADASASELISEVEALYGLEGYARYFKILEVVAGKMDHTNRCEVAYPWQKWQEILRGKRGRLTTFLTFLQERGAITFREENAEKPGRFPEATEKQTESGPKQNGNILRIKVPNLLKIRDNYSTNLQVTTPPTCKLDLDLDLDQDHPPPIPPEKPGGDAEPSIPDAAGGRGMGF